MFYFHTWKKLWNLKQKFRRNKNAFLWKKKKKKRKEKEKSKLINSREIAGKKTRDFFFLECLKKNMRLFSHTQKYFFFPEYISSPCFSDEKKDLKKITFLKYYFLNVIINSLLFLIIL